MLRNLNKIGRSKIWLRKSQRNDTFMNSASDLGRSKSTVQYMYNMKEIGAGLAICVDVVRITGT
jgi:hypothetical protein